MICWSDAGLHDDPSCVVVLPVSSSCSFLLPTVTLHFPSFLTFPHAAHMLRRVIWKRDIFNLILVIFIKMANKCFKAQKWRTEMKWIWHLTYHLGWRFNKLEDLRLDKIKKQLQCSMVLQTVTREIRPELFDCKYVIPKVLKNMVFKTHATIKLMPLHFSNTIHYQ